MFLTRQQLVFTGLLLLTLYSTSPADNSPPASPHKGRIEKGFVRLFDGKSFRGWEGNLKAFRVEKGAIVAGSLKKKIPNNEFLCTKQKFKDFELRLDVRLIGRGKNAGIQFRSARIPNHHEVKGYQADVGSMGKESIWGALYDESRRRKFLARGNNAKLKKTVRSGGWNAIVIRCKGKRVEIWVNKVKTVDYTEKQANIPQNGIIGLQIHSGPPTEAWYKNIRIKKL